MALKPLNSAGGFSVGDFSITTVIYPNTDVFTANLTVNNFANLGNVGNIYIGGGNSGAVLSTDGLGNLNWSSAPSVTEIHNGNSNVTIPTQDGNIYINANSGTDQQWVFDTSGVLTLANSGGYAQIASLAGSNIDIYTGGSGSQYSEIYMVDNGNIYVNTQGATHSWIFDSTGNLIVPASSSIRPVSGTLNLTDSTGNSYIDLDPSNIYLYTNYEGSEWQWTLDSTGNTTFPAIGTANLGNLVTANYANFANDVTITGNANVTGNVTASNAIVANVANLANNYVINSQGFYYTQQIPYTQPQNYSTNLLGFTVIGNTTTGSNVLSNVTLLDGYLYDTLNLGTYSTQLTNQVIVNLTNGYWPPDPIDLSLPIGTTITSVDAANNLIYLSQNATGNISQDYFSTVLLLSNSATNTQMVSQMAFLVNASQTNSSNNTIVVDNMDILSGFTSYQYYPIQFIGTGFGNITSGYTYYTGNIDVANNQITICNTISGSDVPLTNGTGNQSIVDNSYNTPPFPCQSINGGYYQNGPYLSNPLPINTLTETPSVGYIGNTTLQSNSTNFNRPVDFNSTDVLFAGAATTFTRFNNGVVISDSQYGSPTINGTLAQVPLIGFTTVHTGLNPNVSGAGVSTSIYNYTDNGSDQANIISPYNPPAFSFTTYEGNINTPSTEQYILQGRVLGRLTFNGLQVVNGQAILSPPSTPVAGVYAQALGDWNGNTNANLPMVLALQYSPLNAEGYGGHGNYSGIPRTFLQAANNTTSIGSATNIEFKPISTTTGANPVAQKSISALGNISINPQQWMNISGYTTGNCLVPGVGSLVNITTTDSVWDGNVALRLSKTVGNTANIEFQIPKTSANTLLIIDNSSNSTVASVQNGFFNLPNYPAATLRTLIGVSGSVAAVNDNSNKLAYWNGSGWYYVKDDTAV